MGFQYKKSLGQNFLQDNNILNKIVASVSVGNNDLIIEIGPGHGALTKKLVDMGCDVLAFEVDLRVKEYLDKINCFNLKVVYQDILQVDFREYDFSKYDKIHVIANIPYYITTPIIEKIINSNINEVDMTLMVQKEVADRFSAKPGSQDYGSVSVYLNYFYDISTLTNVSRHAFYPVPNVDSAVIKLVRHNKYQVTNEEKFFKFVKQCFQYKRKNIRNNLKGYDLEKVSLVLKNYGHDLSSRAEEFSIIEFIDLYNSLF